MWKPTIIGEVWGDPEVEHKTFTDRETDKKREYMVRAINLLIREPEKTMIRVGVMGDEVLDAGVKDGAVVQIGIASYSVEKNVQLIKALPEDIKVGKAKPKA